MSCTATELSADRLYPLVMRRIPELDSGSDRSFRRARAWLNDCQNNHKCRHPPANARLPTRVLDVSFSPSSIALVETRGMLGQYVALSHCWGTSPRLTANKNNFRDLTKGIPISSLPKTFRDAITITQKLQVKYLWIGIWPSFIVVASHVPQHIRF